VTQSGVTGTFPKSVGRAFLAGVSVPGMKTPVQNKLLGVLPLTLILSATATAGPAASGVAVLATPERRAVETQALVVTLDRAHARVGARMVEPVRNPR
jgi:hypothetical protein